jgi:endonuclease/exonuclease/phosphatase (EEP) superfamily protein YafD
MNRLARLLLAVRIRAAATRLAQSYAVRDLTDAERIQLHEARERLSRKLARLRSQYRARFLAPGEAPTYRIA